MKKLSLLFSIMFFALFAFAQTVDYYPQSAPYNTGTTNGIDFVYDSEIYAESGVDRHHGFAKFDVSEIPEEATIEEVVLNYYSNGGTCPYFDITELNVDPITGDATTVFDAIVSGTMFFEAHSCTYDDNGWHALTLNGDAVSALQNTFANGWFAVGFYEYETSGSYYIDIDGWNQANPPYLSVTYTELIPEPPLCPVLVSPADLSTGVEVSPTLEWTPNETGSAPTGYLLTLYSGDPPVYIHNAEGIGNVLNFTPEVPLDYSTTYYWEVNATNEFGESFECMVWSFTTREEPGMLSGTVTDQDTELPIEGAMVMAEGDAGFGLAETDEFGNYEMELAPGDYDVICEATGYETGGVIVTFAITILPGQTFPLNFNLTPIVGADCANPILIDAFPYEDLGQTNCGMGNNYSETCLGSYDGGEDIFYSFTLSETTALNITFDPYTTTWTGIAVFDECPPPASGGCITTITNSSATVRSIENLILDAGTYYIMIDTYAAPDCIPVFDLMIEEYVEPILGCKYTVKLYDSWGDGWDGNALTVNVNGNPVLDEVTLDDGNGPAIFEFYAETDDVIEFIVGTDTYGENTYYVYDANDELVFEDGPYPTGGSIIADCGDCQYSVKLYDYYGSGYGDGWNGGTLDVLVDGIPVLEDITLSTGMGPAEFFFTVFTGSVVDFDYTAGNYPTENYYYAYDANGMEVFSSGFGGVTPGDGQIIGNCAAETGTLAGVITDGITDLPIEGATVMANDGIVDYTTETDETGAYEMVLVTGEYDVTATAPGYEPGGDLDAIVTIYPDITTPLNFNLLPILGSNCSNPILIDAFPYQDYGQTNCGLGDMYDDTECLGAYDNGEDILYQFVITETVALTFTLDPKTTTYAGLGIFEGCPDMDICIDTYKNGSSTDVMTLSTVIFEPGTYFVMVDTWSTPDCIPEFDLLIEEVSPGSLSGVVTSLESGNPLEGVSVFVEPGPTEVFTNALGEYGVELFPGGYDVTFSHIDYYTRTESGVAIVSEQITPLDVSLETMPAPVCADLVSPADNSINNYPDVVLEWESPVGSPTALGYKITLYNVTTDEWLEENTDLGNVTTYTPAQPFEWGTQYVWLLAAYNNAGESTNCTPWYFTISYSGVIDGFVENTQTGMPVEDVDVAVVEVFPNSGYTHDLTTDVDGNWELEWETGVYNITFSKFGYHTKTVNTVSILNGQVTPLNITLDPVTPYPMPFVEDWESNDYNAQEWTKAGDNWRITPNGNPGYTAEFYYSPLLTDYSVDLQSYYIDGRNESEVFVQFDLFLYNYDFTLETMSFMVNDGNGWVVVETFDNQGGIYGDIPWTTFTYDVSSIVAGKQFLLGFRAEGENSNSIFYWRIDNILVTNSIFEVDPPSISDVLFFNESKTYNIDLSNFGIGDLDWEAEITPASPWASLNEVTGTLAPGSDIVELTFDAGLADPGVHTAEITFTAIGGLIEKTVVLELKVYEEDGQQIMIPEPKNWGYISTYIDMDAKETLETLFADIVDDMVILIGDGGVFWPGYSINTLGDYDTYQGYKMKMNGDGSLAFLGDMVTDQTAFFNAGMYMIPVLSEGPVPADEIFGDHDIEFAFGLDGSIYWPAGPVMTLTTLYPGVGYIVKFNAPTTLDFDVALPKAVVPNKPTAFANTTTWNDVYKTSGFHLLGITAEATAELQENDIIGVFNSDGLCTGMVNYTGSNEALAIPVFVDDITTTEIDGMVEYEPMQINIFRDGEEIAANPVYSYAMPNHNGLFANNGYSLITSFKEGSTGIVDNSSSIRVYPNPSQGMFTIDGFDGTFQISVSNSQGQLILKKEINDAYQLDLTSNPNGIYFIRLTSERSVKLVKVIKQ